MTLLELLMTIAQHVWLGDVVSLCILSWLLIMKVDNTVKSSVVSMVVVVVFSGIAYRYTNFIMQLNPGVEKTAVQLWLTGHPHWHWFSWYMALAGIDFMAIFAISNIHLRFNIWNSYITRLLLLTYFADGMLNIIRFVERYVWATDYTDALYQWGIASITVGTGVSVLAVSSLQLLKRCAVFNAGKGV